MAAAADASQLPEDLVVEILSRVPYSSLCRFKCVSTSWLALCSDPGLRRRTPQTLSGFFYRNHRLNRRRYVNVSGRGQPMVDPSLSFLPAYRRIEFVDSSNGLLLCRCVRMSRRRQFVDYAVCNPATERYTVLPYTKAMVDDYHIMCLGFDPAVSAHFRVLLLMQDRRALVSGVLVYSSEMPGVWTHRHCQWGDNCDVNDDFRGVFFNGIMHFTTWRSSVVTVDLEGKTWRTIPTPEPTDSSFVGVSRGQLHLVRNYANGLSVWVLEDYGTEQWIHKHTVDTLHLLFGPYKTPSQHYIEGTAIHPELNLIFFIVGKPRHLLSYKMDSKTVHYICTLGDYFVHPCLPYIPCFSEWLSDGH